ncbi:DUF86 domain-containing protein [Candidatus Gottesmanbacteria bacterium]|nr:DUF86 domain-containing protein [Candidatus Gottesmanbacteria bacterium]
MTKDYRLVIDDMLESIAVIESYVQNVDELTFSQDQLIQDAVIRRIGIIGEAARKLPADIQSFASSVPWKSVIGFRNIVIHDYANVSLGQVWDIVVHDLPALKKNIEELRRKLPEVQPPI